MPTHNKETKKHQTVHWIDRTKTYYQNFWYLPIKGRWWDTPLALWNLTGATTHLIIRERLIMLTAIGESFVLDIYWFLVGSYWFWLDLIILRWLWIVLVGSDLIHRLVTFQYNFWLMKLINFIFCPLLYQIPGNGLKWQWRCNSHRVGVGSSFPNMCSNSIHVREWGGRELGTSCS